MLTIRQPQALFDAMDEWNTSHHNASGLIDRIEKEGVTEREAEAMTLAFLESHVGEGEARCAATQSGKTGVSCPASCPTWNPISTTAW